MAKASAFFTDAERARIREAVAAAERRTTGEIVPVLATESGDYDRQEHVAGFLFALLVLALVWTNAQGVDPATGTDAAWGAAGTGVKLGLAPVLGLLVLAYAVGVGVAARLWFLRGLFAGDALMARNVAAAAAAAFHTRRLASTRASTGVMIYVSLFERVVRVVGDDAIAARLTDADWAGVRDLALAGFKSGAACDGLCAAIARAGEILAAHFPAQPGDVNELPDDLQLID